MAKKKKEIELTYEEKRQQDYDKFVNDRLEFVPDPTYFYQVGDRVSIGNLKEVYVHDIFKDGKMYEIDYTSINNNYGNPIRHEHQRMFTTWLDIRPYNDEDDSNKLINNDDLRLNYSQRSMGDIFSKVYYFGVDFEPEYQRDYVWELNDKIALIDSIFNNIDIGKFAFIHLNYGEKYTYEILDGKQRLRAILDYYENRFKYNGKYFNELSWREQNHFENYNISIAEVQNSNRKQIMKYFVVLNKHGKIMDKAQIEKVERMIDEL